MFSKKRPFNFNNIDDDDDSVCHEVITLKTNTLKRRKINEKFDVIHVDNEISSEESISSDYENDNSIYKIYFLIEKHLISDSIDESHPDYDVKENEMEELETIGLPLAKCDYNDNRTTYLPLYLTRKLKQHQYVGVRFLWDRMIHVF